MSDWTIKDDLEMLLLKEIEGGAFVYVPDMYSPERDNVKANMIKGCPESRIDDLYKKHYEPQLTEKDKKIQTLEAKVKELEGAIDIIEGVKKIEEVKTLEAKIKDYESGHRGACFTCEPVGELNKKLEAKVKELEMELDSRETVPSYSKFLEALLIEACGLLNNDKWYVFNKEHRNFLNKPEVKKLLKQGF